MKVVYVEWADALVNASWFTKQQAREWCEDASWIVKECGWLIEETDKYIVFASGWKTADEYTSEQFVNLHKIPKTWIIKRKELKI